MKTYILSAALAVLTTAALAEEATLQCGDADIVAPALAEDYGEHAAWSGKDTDGLIITLYLNPSTKTWTIFGAGDGGKACMFFSGETFSLPRPEVVGTDG